MYRWDCVGQSNYSMELEAIHWKEKILNHVWFVLSCAPCGSSARALETIIALRLCFFNYQHSSLFSQSWPNAFFNLWPPLQSADTFNLPLSVIKKLMLNELWLWLGCWCGLDLPTKHYTCTPSNAHINSFSLQKL